MTGRLFSSSATTDGTRFEPSSPGITTGLSPCMKATREFVVPRSIPTMRSVAIIPLQKAEVRMQEVNASFFSTSAFLLLTSELMFPAPHSHPALDYGCSCGGSVRPPFCLVPACALLLRLVDRCPHAGSFHPTSSSDPLTRAEGLLVFLRAPVSGGRFRR